MQPVFIVANRKRCQTTVAKCPAVGVSSVQQINSVSITIVQVKKGKNNSFTEP